MAEGFSKLFGTSFDDPRTQGILGLAGGLLEAGGYQSQPMTLGQALSYGGRQGMQSYQTALEAQRAEADRKLREQQLKQSMEIQAAQEARRAEAAKVAAAEKLRQQRSVNQLLMPTGAPTVEAAQALPSQTEMAYARIAPEAYLEKRYEAETAPSEMPQSITRTITENGVEKEQTFLFNPRDPRANEFGMVPFGEKVIQPEPKAPNIKTKNVQLGNVLGTQDVKFVGIGAPGADEDGFVNWGSFVPIEENGQKFAVEDGGFAIDSTGKLIGNVLRNTDPESVEEGNVFLVQPDGNQPVRPLSPGDQIITKEQYKSMSMPIAEFNKLGSEIVTADRSIQQIKRYGEQVGDANQGLAFFIDEVSAKLVTLFTENKLSKEQLAGALSKGSLQGLIGASRLEVVGGGVMTEQDALRIIEFLGGNPNALRNKERVKAALNTIMSDKLFSYNDNIKKYNTQVRLGYFKIGKEEKAPLSMKDVEITMTNFSKPEGVSQEDWDSLSDLQKKELIKAGLSN